MKKTKYFFFEIEFELFTIKKEILVIFNMAQYLLVQIHIQ